MVENEDWFDPTQTWGYYESLEDGDEREVLYLEWFDAGFVGGDSFDRVETRHRMVKFLSAFYQALKENPTDMRYIFQVISNRQQMTSENVHLADDLTLIIQPNTATVTMNDLRTFTGRVVELINKV